MNDISRVNQFEENENGLSVDTTRTATVAVECHGTYGT